MKYAALLSAIDVANQEMRGRAAAIANSSLVVRNWLVGAYLVEFEQRGSDRAKYGVRLLEQVARDLRASGLKGLDQKTLRECRSVFRCYPQVRQALLPEIVTPALLRSLPAPPDAASGVAVVSPSIRGAVRPEFPKALLPHVLLRLSWSKLREIVRIDDPWQRAFYEQACIAGRWSDRQLRRQLDSMLYERTGFSTDHAAVIARAQPERAETIDDLVRDPYVLEFTGLAQRPVYLESDLESALLEHLQTFLLELGDGFCFEARQRRVRIGDEDDYIDLVFYQRLVRCHVLLDLKVRRFRPADAGQMNAYLNWWKEHGMGPGDADPIGIILCSDREQAAVQFATAGMDNRLFVSRYLVALPSVDRLRAFLEADRERIESMMERSRARKVTKGRGRKAKHGLYAQTFQLDGAVVRASAGVGGAIH